MIGMGFRKEAWSPFDIVVKDLFGTFQNSLDYLELFNIS